MSLSLYRGNDNLDNSRSLELPDGIFDRLQARGIDPAALGLDLNSSFDITDVRDSGNTGVGFVWSRQWNRRVHSDVSLGYSRYDDVRERSARVGSNNNPSAEDNRVEDLTFKASIPITLGVGHTLEGGLEVTSNDIAYGFQSGAIRQGDAESPLADVLNQSTQGRLTSLFLQDRWLLGSRLLVVPGIRLTSFDGTSQSFTEPRLAATYFVNDRFKLKAAAGRYQQFTNRITREDLLQGNREFWSLANGTTVPVARATHLIGGGAYERGSLLVDVEIFAKDLSDLTQFAPRLTEASAELDFDEFFYHGDGTVRSAEVLVQKRTGRHTGWVAYTLSKVEEVFPEFEPDPFPATHDQRHELKIVNILDFGKWHVSETFVYASGKPSARTEGARRAIRSRWGSRLSSSAEPVGLEAFELPFGGMVDRVVAGVTNASRLPDYHRLDLALNREVPFGDSAGGIFSLTLFNAYNRQNTWYKEFNVVEGEIVENNILLMGLTLNASLSVKF